MITDEKNNNYSLDTGHSVLPQKTDKLHVALVICWIQMHEEIQHCSDSSSYSCTYIN